MTSGDWIAIVGISVTAIGGVIGWLTYIAINVGKIVQKLDGFRDDLLEIREDVDELDRRADLLERRVVFPAH